jgi:acyl-CoA dehydrogenase
MTNQFALTEDQLAIQDMAQKFTADRITPFAAQWDEEHHYPVDVWKAAGELGFGAIYVSEESGGIGLGRLEAALIMEAMAYGCPTTSAFISIHNMASWMIDRFGGADIKARYLPQLITMEKIASYCLTEPGSGSDAAALRTTARLEGDHYVVNGTKQFISGGGVSDVYVTMVRTGDASPKGISCLVIDKGTPGLSFGAPERKLGWNASPTAQVIFENVKVPVANRVGAEGDGFRFAMAGLDGGRLNIGACSLGGAQRCLDEAIKYAKERSQFGQPIARFQVLQHRMVDIFMEVEQAKSMTTYAMLHLDKPAAERMAAVSQAKAKVSRGAKFAGQNAVQTHGGIGITQELAIGHYFKRATMIEGQFGSADFHYDRFERLAID